VENEFHIVGVSSAIIFRVVLVVMACTGISWLLAGRLQEFGPRATLWRVVHNVCVPDQLQRQVPSPCVQVDLRNGIDKGFAILKDVRGATQLLLIPTARISGIESSVIRRSDAPNYLAEAWEARTYIDEALGRTLPRDDIGLAVNSVASRTQDQFHIHVDCIRSELREALRQNEAAIGDKWASFDAPNSGHRYMAIWVPGERLGLNNPFRILAEGIPGAAQNMGDRTLVVVGSSRANGAPGFVLLEDQVNRETQDRAQGEELLDHTCRIATAVQP
jgi:CDP-diacylglycerol pyrophosphatase